MANPQMENGYTRIINELFDAIAKYKASRIQKDIIFTVIRFTEGYNKKSAIISLSKVATYLNESVQSISAALNKLIDQNVIEVSKNYSSHNGREVKINIDYESWKVPDSSKKGFGKNKNSMGQNNAKTQNNMNKVGQNNTNLNDDLPQNNMKPETQNNMNTCKDNLFKNNLNKDNLKITPSSKINYSISFLPPNLNGETFYLGKFFWVDKSLINDLKISIPELIKISDEQLLNEFDRMTDWLGKNGQKKNYKSFFIRWLTKTSKEGSEQKLLALFQELYFENRKIEYEVTNRKRDLFYIKKLIETYQAKHPDNSFEELVKDFNSFFSACLDIQEKWFWRNMSPSLIVNKFNEIKIELKRINQGNQRSGATIEGILKSIAKNFDIIKN